MSVWMVDLVEMEYFRGQSVYLHMFTPNAFERPSFNPSSPPFACRSQPFRASPLQRAMAVFRLSLTLVAAALARGACALCHRVRVRALGAIMCAVAFACKPCCCRQSDHRSPSPRALCRRDDSTWSMPRRAPSEVARLFIVRFNMLQNLTSHSYTVSGTAVLAVS